MLQGLSIADVMRGRAGKAKEQPEQAQEQPKKEQEREESGSSEDETSSVDEREALKGVSVSSSDESDEKPKEEKPKDKAKSPRRAAPSESSTAAEEEPPVEAAKPASSKTRKPLAREKSAPRRMVTREDSDAAFFIFRQYDENNSGGLSASELKLLLQNHQLGVKLSDEEVELAVKLLSKSGAQEISYRDFSNWWLSDDRFKMLHWTPEEVRSMVLARDMFARFDRDGNGVISRSEFRTLHKQLLGDGFDVPENLDDCLELVDKNRSGSIDFQELVTFLRSIDAFRKREQLLEAKEEQEKADKSMTPEKYVAAVLERTNYAVLKAFRKYDADNSSSISASEFRRLVRDLGFNLTEEETALQVKLIATRGGTEIEFGEFKKWWMEESRVAALKWDQDELAKYRFFSDLFDQHDGDRSGIIDEKEFALLYAKMEELGFELPPEKECLKAISKSNRVSFNDFVAFLKSTRAFQYWKIK